MDVGIWGLAAKLFLNYCTCAEEKSEWFSVGVLICILQDCKCHLKMDEEGVTGIARGPMLLINR